MATNQLTLAATKKDVAAYNKLLKTLREEISTSEKELKEIVQRKKTETYWSLGKLISEFLEEAKKRPYQGQGVVEKLGEDLNIGVKTLYSAVKSIEVTHQDRLYINKLLFISMNFIGNVLVSNL